MYDVGIAEQHAVTMATGLALGGLRPFVAIYSTFLQRAFDQLVHDVCQNDAPVVIGVDRAGLVGEDGTSHQGMFTLSAQRQLPNLVVASPKDEQEAAPADAHRVRPGAPVRAALPARSRASTCPLSSRRRSRSAKAEVMRDGQDILIVGFGPIVMRGVEVADPLAAEGWSVAVINARFAKPLDLDLIVEQARGKKLVVTLEESVVSGGFGSAVLEGAQCRRSGRQYTGRCRSRSSACRPTTSWTTARCADLRRYLRIDVTGITEQVREAIAELGLKPAPAADDRGPLGLSPGAP